MSAMTVVQPKSDKRMNPESFKREFMNFGIEVIKFPRTGPPGARVIHLSLDPLQIYWVGKGGKRKYIDLGDVVSLKRGNSSDGISALPSEGFRKVGRPENADRYISVGVGGEGRESLDIELPSAEKAEFFAIVLGAISPSLLSAGKT